MTVLLSQPMGLPLSLWRSNFKKHSQMPHLMALEKIEVK